MQRLLANLCRNTYLIQFDKGDLGRFDYLRMSERDWLKDSISLFPLIYTI